MFMMRDKGTGLSKTKMVVSVGLLLLFAGLMLVAGGLMFVEAKGHVGLFEVTNSLAFNDPKDLAFLCVLLACLVMPFALLLLHDINRDKNRVLFAPFISLAILLAFPLEIDGR